VHDLLGLDGRVVVVSGAGGGGIGNTVTRMTAKAGATVVAVSRSTVNLDEHVAPLAKEGLSVVPVSADASTDDGIAAVMRTVAPNRRPYRTSDGYIAALIYNDRHWNAFVDAVRPDWNSDDYATLELRAHHIDAVYGLLAETMKERTTAEWLALFRELEIPAAPINTPGKLFDNAHLNAAGLFETVDTPHGPVRFPGVPTWFSRTPGRVAGPAPSLGEDTDDVLGELGLTDTECAETTVYERNRPNFVSSRSVGADSSESATGSG
jgi:hypothetical protein